MSAGAGGPIAQQVNGKKRTDLDRCHAYLESAAVVASALVEASWQGIQHDAMAKCGFRLHPDALAQLDALATVSANRIGDAVANARIERIRNLRVVGQEVANG